MTMTFSGTSGVTFPDTTTQVTAATASIPAGAKTNFLQAAAPTGWTQCTSYNNYAMRLVSGTGGGTGGSVGFTTAFASQTPAGTVAVGTLAAGATTLTTCQIPSHSHTIRIYGGAGGGTTALTCLSSYAQTSSWSNVAVENATGGGGSHTHTLSGSPTFTGTAINLAVQYVDNIVATKN